LTLEVWTWRRIDVQRRETWYPQIDMALGGAPADFVAELLRRYTHVSVALRLLPLASTCTLQALSVRMHQSHTTTQWQHAYPSTH
jgi:hypothetical protein